MDDFQTEQVVVQRRRLLADLLRKQALQTQSEDMPGRMISGHYVAPSWSQNLNNLGRPFAAENQAAAEEQRAATAEQDYNSRVNQARQQWQSSLPQATMQGAHPEFQGPAEQQGSPELAANPGQRVLPDRQSVLQATMRGMEIPGNQHAADLYYKGSADEQNREDIQAEKAHALQLTMAQARQKQIEDLGVRQQQIETQKERYASEAARDTATAIERERAHRATEALTKAGQENAMAIAQLRADAAKATGAQAGQVRERDIQTFTQKLGDDAKDYAIMTHTGQGIQNMLDKYKKPDGTYGSIPGVGFFSNIWTPAQKAEALANRAAVQMFTNAVARSQIGLSQTITEQAKLDAENMANGKFSQAAFLRNWPQIVDKSNAQYNKLLGQYGPDVMKRFNDNARDANAGEDTLRHIRSYTPEERQLIEQRKASYNQTSQAATAGGTGVVQGGAFTADKAARLAELRAKAAGGTPSLGAGPGKPGTDDFNAWSPEVLQQINDEIAKMPPGTKYQIGNGPVRTK